MGSRRSYHQLLSVVAVIVFIQSAQTIKWLGLNNRPQGYKWTPKDCSNHASLTPGQISLCKDHRELMNYVQTSATQTRMECKDQMQDRRWDCTSVDKAPHFGYDLSSGTKEAAFVHALSAATLMLTVSRACLSGKIPGCTCKVSGLFVKVNQTNQLETTDFDACPNFLSGEFHFVKRFLSNGLKGGDKQKLKADWRIMRHNTRLGQNSIKNKQPIRCRCHGVTGSCTMKHCMKQLPLLQDIAQDLIQKYDNAVRINPNQERSLAIRGRKKRLSVGKGELLFMEDSPSYCSHDGKYGTRGTTGRECNPYSKGDDGCMKMCCGRGAQVETIEILERCRCKYVWCCYVECDQCKKTRKRFTCR